MKLVFLGTGGGRHAAMFQIRNTGGMLILSEKGNVHVDPGPGALTRMNQISYDLQKTDAIIVSHSHLDHYSDAGYAIEGMTKGGWVKRGALYASISCIEGFQGVGPAFTFHLSIPEKVQMVKAGDIFDVAGIKMEFTKLIHTDPTNVGMKIHTEHGVIGYASDTEFTEDIAKQYIGSRLLILPLTVPDDKKIRGHMDLNGIIEFTKIVKPDMVILNHLGIRTVEVGPDKQAKIATDATGIPIVAGRDLMTVDFGESIVIDQLEPEDHDWLDFWKAVK